jgi:hypothetical protein
MAVSSVASVETLGRLGALLHSFDLDYVLRLALCEIRGQNLIRALLFAAAFLAPFCLPLDRNL